MFDKILQFLGIRPYPEIRFGDAAVAAQYAAVEKEHPRSPKWPAKRKAWLKDHDTCEGCGIKDFLEVHHVEAFHEHPEKELDDTNFMTLCEKPSTNCHLNIGHLGNFKSINVDARKDAAWWFAKRKNRP